MALVAASTGWARYPGKRHQQIEHSHFALGDWRLDMARDRFTDDITCRLKARGNSALFMAGAVGFRFDHGSNVSDAIYRIDGGMPRPSRNDLPGLIALGVPLDRGGMTNASGGYVWIPYAQLAKASSVIIEIRATRVLRTFHVRGLKELYDAALEQGCSPSRRFVEQ